MGMSNTKSARVGALLLATLVSAWPLAGQATVLECRSESMTPGKDAAKAKSPPKTVGQKFDVQLQLPQNNFEWRSTDRKYLKDFVMGSFRTTVFWVDRESGEYWTLVFNASARNNPPQLISFERLYEYTGRCAPKKVDAKF